MLPGAHCESGVHVVRPGIKEVLKLLQNTHIHSVTLQIGGDEKMTVST